VLHPEPWLDLGPAVRDAYSAGLGLALGGLSVVATRAMVQRWGWAQRLHGELRPIARGITSTGIVVLAVTSAAGEELLFRGLLAPWIGLWPQALIFGLATRFPAAAAGSGRHGVSHGSHPWRDVPAHWLVGRSGGDARGG